jgi:cytochrome P450
MKKRFPDGPRINLPLAVLGQILPALFPFDGLSWSLDIARQFGDIVHYKLGALHVYQLNHPDLARRILVEQPEKFRKPWLLKRVMRPIAGDGLVTSDGALWKQQRKLMQPAFHQRRLAVYGEVMVAQATGMMESFDDGEIREIGAEMTRLTLGVVVKALFGSDLPCDAEDIRRLMTAVLDSAGRRMSSVLRIPSWAPTPRNLRERRALGRLDGILHVLIEGRRAAAESRDDLLSLLLAAVDEDSGSRMSDEQLHVEMMTIFLAGHETTASALTWTWYLLARHPQADAKLLDELRGVLAGRAPTVTDLPNMPYTEMVIRESLRLYPPAPAFGREPIEDVTIGAYEVPKGSLVMVNSYAMQRDARFFTDPDRFNPDRFAAGWEERVPRYAYLPFGGGPRVCIGNGFAMMEARLILATVAQRWKLSLETADEIRPKQVVTVRPSGPLRMRIEKR